MKISRMNYHIGACFYKDERMQPYKITIITVTFNAVKTLKQTIESVLGQTYDNIEYLVIDGGSTDGTVELLKLYGEKICWISEPDKGIYDAMNKGVHLSTGDYIQFIGADDCLMHKDVIQHVASQLEDTTDILSAGQMLVEEKSHLERYMGYQKPADGAAPWMPHIGMFTRKALLQKYPFDLSYSIGADFDFILKCVNDSSVCIKYVDFPVAYFCDGGVSSTQKAKANEETKNICKKWNLNAEALTAVTDKSGKAVIKSFLDSIGVLSFLRGILSGWKKHQCHNKVCRWCNRGISLK